MQVKNLHRQEFFARVAVGRDGGFVHHQKPPRDDVIDPHGHRGTFKQRRVTLLTFKHGLLGKLAVGDVLERAHQLGGLAVLRQSLSL